MTHKVGRCSIERVDCAPQTDLSLPSSVATPTVLWPYISIGILLFKILDLKFQIRTMEMETLIAWSIAGVTLLILSIFALVVFLKRKTIFRFVSMAGYIRTSGNHYHTVVLLSPSIITISNQHHYHNYGF